MQAAPTQESSTVQNRPSSQAVPSLGDQPSRFLAGSQSWHGFSGSTAFAATHDPSTMQPGQVASVPPSFNDGRWQLPASPVQSAWLSVARSSDPRALASGVGPSVGGFPVAGSCCTGWSVPPTPPSGGVMALPTGLAASPSAKGRSLPHAVTMVATTTEVGTRVDVRKAPERLQKLFILSLFQIDIVTVRRDHLRQSFDWRMTLHRPKFPNVAYSHRSTRSTGRSTLEAASDSQQPALAIP